MWNTTSSEGDISEARPDAPLSPPSLSVYQQRDQDCASSAYSDRAITRGNLNSESAMVHLQDVRKKPCLILSCPRIWQLTQVQRFWKLSNWLTSYDFRQKKKKKHYHEESGKQGARLSLEGRLILTLWLESGFSGLVIVSSDSSVMDVDFAFTVIWPQ